MAKKRRRKKKKKVSAGNILKRIAGGFAIVLGIGIGCGVVYSLIYGTKKGRSHSGPVGGFLVTSAFITVGFKWMMDKE